MIVQKGLVRILIVDDDEDDFFFTSDYIKHIAGGNFKIDWCPKYKDALQHMIARNYDLYFVDYLLGAKSGVDLLKEALANNCEEPIILLTGKGNYEVDIEAMQLGAVDYLIKTDLSTEKIERSIRYALERSATLKALKANERKYRSIFERSKDLVFIADAELNFIDVNEVVTPLLGYAKDEALQLNIYDLVEQDGSRQFLKQAIEEQKEVNDWEVMLTTKSGEKKWCILTAAYEDNVNSQSYVQGIIHDISNLKRAEKATLQAEKLAAAGRLVRTLAHEVRNPLNNITLSIEQLQQDIKDENGLMFMDIIHRNSRRISDLISELLSTSRPSEIVMQEHVLQEVIDDVVEVAIDRLTLKRIKLQISYPDEPQYVMADKEKLRIAILNIVINAIEAMEEQTGNLSISLHHLLHHVVLNISDNGCGIPEENISRLFEPYFTQKRNGMGLGLASTLNILQAHNANIEVSSVVNGGTTFTITFPLVKNDED
jgi:PAS domain S-box-containing protein